MHAPTERDGIDRDSPATKVESEPEGLPRRASPRQPVAHTDPLLQPPVCASEDEIRRADELRRAIAQRYLKRTG